MERDYTVPFVTGILGAQTYGYLIFRRIVLIICLDREVRYITDVTPGLEREILYHQSNFSSTWDDATYWRSFVLPQSRTPLTVLGMLFTPALDDDLDRDGTKRLHRLAESAATRPAILAV